MGFQADQGLNVGLWLEGSAELNPGSMVLMCHGGNENPMLPHV